MTSSLKKLFKFFDFDSRLLDIFAAVKKSDMRNIWLLSLLLLFCCLGLNGEERQFHPLHRNQSYQTFKNISLPVDANIVNTIFQDDSGMIWLGTMRGLYSYNGYDLHEYVDETYSGGNPIFAIVQVTKDYLCLGTDNGVRWFDLGRKTFGCPYKEQDLTLAVRSLALFDGHLWIGTRDLGLKKMSLASGLMEDVDLQNETETTIYSLEATEDRLYVASYEHLSYYDCSDTVRRTIDLGSPERLMVNSLLWDRKRDCIWAGTEGHLYRYDIKTGKVHRQSILTGNSFKTLTLDHDGNLLIGTDAGLFVFDFDSNTHTRIVHDSRNPRSLCNNIIWDILCDRNNNVWLATGRGVSLAQRNVGQHYIYLSEIVRSGDGNLFTYMLMDSHGDYWLGGENGLIHIDGTAPYEAEWFRQDSDRYPLRHNHIRCIYEDSSNDIWITSDGGVARYDRRKRAFDFYQVQVDGSGKNANWAYSILEDRFGRIWIASYMGGLFICRKDNLEILHHFNEDSGIGLNVYLMQDGGNDCIWATCSNGLVSIDINTLEVNGHDLYADNMVCLDDHIWYSISGKLHRYDISEKKSTEIPFSETCRKIHSFIRENDMIWFTSSEGIFRIEPETSVLTNISHTSDNYPCGLYDHRNNDILLGGEDCLTRIDVDKKSDVTTADPVRITSLISDGTLMRAGKDYCQYGNRIELKEESDIIIELSSLSYQADESYHYRFDEEEKWQALGKGNNHISLVNLPGGTYSLELSASDPADNPEATISSWYISVPYPWYLCWQAIVIYIILIAGIITAGIRIIHIRNRKKFELREKERSLELSNMKMDFFVNISHELKTPLSMIMAPVSRMLSETTNARQKETLTTIHNNALRLNTLIHKVLDFRQLEAEGEDVLIRSHTELNSLLRNCLNTFKGIIEEKNISVTMRSSQETVWANIDTLKLESAVINILSNAIKYVSEDTGAVDVALDMADGNAVITISDNGRGIDKEELSLVFIRYFQGKNGKHREGSGIGLYLVKKYIELHGGRISIESGSGTVVRFEIPLTGENSCIVKNDGIADDPADEISAKILIIDDNREMVAFLAETLSRHYDCRKAYNGREGIDAMDGYTPDLIIVDQMMPEMDGFTFTRAVRKSFRTATTPVIMLTAKEDMATELESIRAGVDIFMPKPFDIRKLQLRIAQLLKKRNSIEESVRIEATSKPDFKECRDLKSPDEVFMEKVTKAIEENMGKEDFNVSSLADIVAVDSKQLYRKLKQLTGSTPVNYIRKLRMRKASILLGEDKFTVSEVMFLVGYSNASYFSKCFTEEFGMNPKEYRKQADS